MFCPSCGFEDHQPNQFCRACGTDLRNVRFALEKPDKITASAVFARDEIGRAIADKIREMNSAKELEKVAEDVLPQIEKFLESPEQRRLRAGIVTSAVGLGVALTFLLVSLKEDTIFLAGLGLITFFIGLGIIINGLLFTIPAKSLEDKSLEAQKQRELELDSNIHEKKQYLPFAETPFLSSVPEHTTHKLQDKKITQQHVK
jgi:hypothetical protein